MSSPDFAVFHGRLCQLNAAIEKLINSIGAAQSGVEPDDVQTTLHEALDFIEELNELERSVLAALLQAGGRDQGSSGVGPGFAGNNPWFAFVDRYDGQGQEPMDLSRCRRRFVLAERGDNSSDNEQCVYYFMHDGRLVKNWGDDNPEDNTWEEGYREVHPIEAAYDFRRHKHRPPPELRPYWGQSDPDSYFEWCRHQRDPRSYINWADHHGFPADKGSKGGDTVVDGSHPSNGGRTNGETSADSAKGRSRRPRMPSEDTQARALALLIKNPGLSNKQIAEMLDCNPKSLAPKRAPQLAAARRYLKDERRKYLGEHRDPDSGTVGVREAE